jgi:hypothetical protein
MGNRIRGVLFDIGDALRNVEAARAQGMEAHLVRGPDEARAVLMEHGVIPERDGA